MVQLLEERRYDQGPEQSMDFDDHVCHVTRFGSRLCTRTCCGSLHKHRAAWTFPLGCSSHWRIKLLEYHCYGTNEHKQTVMKRYFVQYVPEPGRPTPTPEAVCHALGIAPADRLEFWHLLTRIATHAAGWILVAVPGDLGVTPLEAALLVRLCAAHGVSIRIVTPSTAVVAEPPAEAGVRVYQTTADFAELAKELLVTHKWS